LPEFLSEVLLGYSSKVDKRTSQVSLLDTFVDEVHLRQYMA
jgi:hypothetical protein